MSVQSPWPPRCWACGGEKQLCWVTVWWRLLQSVGSVCGAAGGCALVCRSAPGNIHHTNVVFRRPGTQVKLGLRHTRTWVAGRGVPGTRQPTPTPHHPTTPQHHATADNFTHHRKLNQLERLVCGCVLVGWTPGLSTGVRWDQQVGLRSQRAPPPATAPQCID